MREKEAFLQKEARQRFGRDMRTLREANGVSLKVISRETCVYVDTLRELEATGLYDHSLLTPVYVRCLVGAYAKVAGLSKDTVLAALNEAFEGSYNGTLVPSSDTKVTAGSSKESKTMLEEAQSSADAESLRNQPTARRDT